MPSTPVNINDPFLNNLQANILKGHGRKFAHHLFFAFNNQQTDAIKRWMASFASTRVTNAKTQLDSTAAFNKHLIKDGGTIITLSLSAHGYDVLGLQQAKPNSQTFIEGMAANAAALGDRPDQWESPFKSTVDLLVIVADEMSTTAKQIADDIVNTTSAFLNLLANQRGNVLKKEGLGIEHFGYADGISQPVYLAEEIAKEQGNKEWKDRTELDLLLINDPGIDDPDSLGSFLVFRKLEQHVKGFKDAEGDNAGVPGVVPTIKDISGAGNKELGGAMLVGRFENSVPVALQSTDQQPNPPVITNDFGYANDTAALKCPFHAHIRLMNPRNGDTIAGDVKEHRITRRGIPYDDVGRIPEEKIEEITDDMLDGNQPNEGVGLLFMCYQSRIENQFEILQAQWANKGFIFPHQIGMQDSLIGQGANPNKTLPIQWDQPAQTKSFAFNGFVTNKGGEYFFTPSIRFLKSLSDAGSMAV